MFIKLKGNIILLPIYLAYIIFDDPKKNNLNMNFYCFICI